MEKGFSRGEVWYVDLGSENIPGEQCGVRPCLIIQNNTGNKYSPTLIVAPLTTSSSKPKHMPTHVEVKLKRPSIALLEQIKTVSKDRVLMDSYVGRATSKEMDQVDHSICVSLGLDFRTFVGKVAVSFKATQHDLNICITDKNGRVNEIEIDSSAAKMLQKYIGNKFPEGDKNESTIL